MKHSLLLVLLSIALFIYWDTVYIGLNDCAFYEKIFFFNLHAEWYCGMEWKEFVILYMVPLFILIRYFINPISYVFREGIFFFFSLRFVLSAFLSLSKYCLVFFLLILLVPKVKIGKLLIIYKNKNYLLYSKIKVVNKTKERILFS